VAVNRADKNVKNMVMDNPILQARGVEMVYRHGRLETPVLFNVDMAVVRGEFVAVMGPSGCGKSTLMHILGLMLRPTRGRVVIDGEDTSNWRESERARLRREKIGFVFQRFNLLGTLTAAQNIAVAQRIRRLSPDGQVTAALAAVGMREKANHRPDQLSMGQQQRVAIARAIAHRPALLLADEPTGNRDSANAEMILRLFREVHERHGITVVMITHSADAARWAERVIRMEDGRIREE